MSEIDQLSIQISADASKAERAIDGLITKLRSLNNALDLGNIGNFKRQLNSIKAAADGIKGVSQSMRGIAKAGTSLSGFGDTEKSTKDINGFIASIKELEGITLPDFSSISVLANGLNRITKINAAKIADVANALNLFKNNDLESSSNAIAKIADSVQSTSRVTNKGVKESFSGMEHILSDDDKALESFYARIRDLKELIAGMKSGKIPANAEQFIEAEKELAVLEEQLKRHKSELRDYAKTAVSSFDTVKEGAQEVKESFVEMNNQPALMDGLENRADTIRGKLGELYAEQERLKQSIAGFKNGKLDVPDEEYIAWRDRLAEVKAEIDSIENSPVGNVTANIREMGEATRETSEKLSELDRYVKQTFEDGFVQNNVSAGLADVLNNIRSLQFELSAMKQRPEIFDRESFINLSRDLETNKKKWEDFEREVSRGIRSKGGLDKLSQEAQRLRDRMEDLKRLMAEMDSGKTGIDVSQYRAWEEELKEVSARYDEIMGKKKEVEKPSKIDFLAGIVTFAHELHNITQTLGGIGDDLFDGLKMAFKPLDWLIEEHKERIKSLADTFKGMVDKIKQHLNRLSAFWKRVMKTFTFMLVRKAITAIIGEISDATKSLALWSKQFGTIFNDSMSQITSNFSFIARGLVGMVEPIINALVPAFNALADAITSLTAKIGEFFAALTGQGYYMVAKRQVTDYAESVDKANKAQKNLIAGLDDLNIITTPTSTASGMDDVAAQWEKVDVSDKMKDFVDEVKDLAQRLFDPIKKGWDEAGEHVKKGFKYMVDEIGKLGKSIGRDFMIVWQQPKTAKIFEDIFHTVGYIEEGIGNIAKRFREAWDEGDKGLHILENIRDIIGIITEHVRDMAKDFRDWANQLDFNPLLKSIENFTKKVQPLVDFLGNVLGDIWNRVILKHWQFQIEDGLPHLFDTISRVIGEFNFDKIRADLQPVEDAFERMRESIDIGLVNAFGNLGTALAEFTNSDEFTEFCKTIAWLMDQITPERVEKLFTALGLAIGQVAGELVKFVNSDKFQNFIQSLLDWYDSKSAEELADVLVKIAKAIAMFKFAQFAGEGVMKFMEVLTMFKALSTMSGGGGLLSGLLGGGGGGLLGALFNPTTLAIIAGIAAAIYSIYESFGGLDGIMEELAPRFERIKQHAIDLAQKTGLAEAIEHLKDGFGKLLEALGNLKSLWQVVFTGFEGLVVLAEDTIIPVLAFIADAFGAICEAVAGVVDIIGGLFDIIVGIFTLDGDKIVQGAGRIGEGIFGAFKGLFDLLVGAGGLIVNLVKGIFDFFKWLCEVLLGDPIVLDICDGIFGAFSGMVELVVGVVGGLVDAVAGFFGAIFDTVTGILGNLATAIGDIVGGIADFLSGAWEGMKTVATNLWNATKEAIDTVWSGIKTGIATVATNIGTFLEGAWNSMKTTAETIWSGIKGGIETAWQGIHSVCDWAAKSLGNLLQGAWNSISTAAQQAWSGISSFAASAWGKIKELANDAWNMAKNIGNAVIDVGKGFINGVGDVIGDMWNGAKDLGGAVINGFCSVLGIHSPSKVFEEFGKMTVAGFNEGIDESADSTEKSLDKWFDDINSFTVPQFDISNAIPKSGLQMDAYTHGDFTGTAVVDNTAIQQSVRQGVMDAIGGLILPYLSDIAESSRETASKELTISDRAIGTAASRYARDFQTRTGRPAFGY